MERRRRVPRQEADWFGRCVVADDPGASYDCRVVDISMLGAGVEVFHFPPRDVLGRRLDVDVQPPASVSFSIHFVGEIRNAGTGPRGRVRLGLEFVDLSEDERSIVDMLERMRMTW
jgi:hypothetical protein